MKWLTKFKPFTSEIFALLSSFLTKMIKPLVSKITNFVTRKAAPDTQQYASNVHHYAYRNTPTKEADMSTKDLSMDRKKPIAPAAELKATTPTADVDPLFSNGIFALFSGVITKMIKPLISNLIKFVTRKATPDAQQYASDVLNNLYKKVPKIVADLTATGLSIVSKGLITPAAGLEAATVAADALTNRKSSLRQLLMLPFKALRVYKNYTAFNSTGEAPSHSTNRFK